MQIWTFSKHHIFKYDFWEKTRYSNMNFWCFLVTPELVKLNVPIVQYQKERSCCNASAIAISTLTSSSVKAKAFESLNHEHTTLSMLIVHSTNQGTCDNISVPQIVAGSFKTVNPIDSNRSANLSLLFFYIFMFLYFFTSCCTFLSCSL